ncbi:transcription factor bHLH115 [Amborella trichopoda]|uniref:BHLH domain-containing protein n=1 Tax=Amborella trichopoda TaxID=13333 RepID=W1NS65_AMBTC|nr:transcription factor bHLH115 [Amborella trichopoda]ERM99871.1 hypothetical protein AMTR_s00098p00170370 [Amborella trichopoda]|eukprot:XP_006837018.1 transcription factor bHLH115 [Amborella trichopoda]
MGSPQNTNWDFDGIMVDDAFWISQASNGVPNSSVDVNVGFDGPSCNQNLCSRKRPRSEPCSGSGSKACREKMRRDRLNDRFLELGAILEPGRPPKTDKATILSDAIRVLNQLQSEARKLKEANDELQEKIKDLKAEKNELRDEKLRLKADKERLEQQVKAINTPPPSPFIPHPMAFSSPQGPAVGAGAKMMPFMGYQPTVAMWQWMPPAAVDTSQDHVLRPPVA